jgi:hypothetical protein
LDGSVVADLVGTTSSTSFTQPTTFGNKCHSPPYNIFYDSPQGPHPNVIFPQDSQVWVSKFGLLLSQNFERSYLFQIKFVLKMQGQHLILLKKNQLCIARPNWSSFGPYFQRVCGWKSNSQFDSHPFLIITHINEV